MPPASMAKAASDRSRPGCDQLISTWAAVTGPTPGWASSAGATIRTKMASSLPSWVASVWAARARSAVIRSARTVARYSTGSLGWAVSAAHARAWRSQVPPRSPVRSGSGAVTSRALRCRRASAATLTAPALVIWSTRRASRWPRWRGLARCSRLSASRPARIASSGSLLAWVRPVRLGRSISVTHSPWSARKLASPAP